MAVGESKAEMHSVCDWVVPRLAPSKPRHLLGVGEIDDIFDIIERGVDTFDCVQPTRLARMGRVYCKNYPINTNKYQLSLPDRQAGNNPINKFKVDITKKEFSQETKPIDAQCTCYTCQNFSRAYLHHLFRDRELLAYRLTTIHNLHFVQTLVENIRLQIQKGTLPEFKRQFFAHRLWNTSQVSLAIDNRL